MCLDDNPLVKSERLIRSANVSRFRQPNPAGKTVSPPVEVNTCLASVNRRRVSGVS